MFDEQIGNFLEQQISFLHFPELNKNIGNGQMMSLRRDDGADVDDDDDDDGDGHEGRRRSTRW